ncbi:hypothetical protein BD324DRAFT_586717 [Kockovaella imperatae]|uniref:XPG-I domain-containing protein n=1 Tax=Kockovaella imperatae TaxID=4999 RepID=A0A1Y1UNV4_9TREE|nr:hypothetical protein BD324DRAFT_586717 [Kockovaella imperatae]ORX39699.1 hypothetical protein BD324DRAFT_586717 [Kockovaella imperatae]
MGVPGLWDLLRPAATRASLSTLSRDAFLANKNGLRALTIGIDASIWIFHAQVPMYGENPFLRTIFYKITSLLQQPVLPVFVFDGPNKPTHKRNQRVAGQFGTADHNSRKFKELLDICGLEWWNAPGEAEAELAVMNRQGKIDAVLSDDVDALLFGATCLLRNNSPTLSGSHASTQNTSSRADSRQYEMYRLEAIRDEWAAREGTMLRTEEDCRLAMILVALLAGGDYAPEGVSSIGPTIAHGLAHAGLADFLRQYDPASPAFQSVLATVRQQILHELSTDESKFLGRRYKACATKLSEMAPNEIFSPSALNSYLRPVTSPLADVANGWPGFGNGEPSRSRGKARNQGRGDLEGMARACEKYFEWGTKELVGKKFAGESVGLFGSEIVNDARDWVMSRGNNVGGPSSTRGEFNKQSGRITSFFATVHLSSPSTSTVAKALHHTQTTPSSSVLPPYIVKIRGKRSDPTNHDLTEYRLSYRTDDFTSRCHDAMEGSRVDPKLLSASERAKLGLVGNEDPDIPSASQISAPSQKNEFRVWLPEFMLVQAWPGLVSEYEDSLIAKEDAKAAKKSGGVKVKRAVAVTEDAQAFKSFFSKVKGKGKAAAPVAEEEEVEEPVETPSTRSSTPQRSVPTIDLTESPDVPGSSALCAKSSSLPYIIKRSRVPSSSSRSASSQPADTESSKAKPPKKPVRRSARLSRDNSSTKGNKDAPISLISSDEETPKPAKPLRKPPAPFPLLAIAKETSLKPRESLSPSKETAVLAASKGKMNAGMGTQVRLELAVVKSTRNSPSKRI